MLFTLTKQPNYYETRWWSFNTQSFRTVLVSNIIMYVFCASIHEHFFVYWDSLRFVGFLERIFGLHSFILKNHKRRNKYMKLNWTEPNQQEKKIAWEITGKAKINHRNFSNCLKDKKQQQHICTYTHPPAFILAQNT